MQRYLLPLLSDRWPQSAGAAMRFLQLAPETVDEALELQRLGHDGQIVIPAGGRMLLSGPLIQASIASLPFAANSFDFVLTGAFASLAPDAASKRDAAIELTRVCRPGGALVLTTGNRRCPIDLINSRRLHRARAATLSTIDELRSLFVDECGCQRLEILSVANLLGYSTLTGTKRRLASYVEHYLRWASNPDRPGRYASALNPVLAMWITP